MKSIDSNPLKTIREKSKEKKPDFYYFDSNAFHRLTKKGTEPDSDKFIDECEAHNIDLSNGYEPIFTPCVLLERVSLGKILEKLQEGTDYQSIMLSVQSFVEKMADPKTLSPTDLEKLQQEVANQLDEMGREFSRLIYQMEDLKKKPLLLRIKEEIDKYATSAAATNLVNTTLRRYYEGMSKATDYLAGFASDLVWNLIAGFPFLKCDHITKKDALPMLNKAEMFFNSLFATAHKLFLEGKNVNFYRLADNRFYTYARIVAKNPNVPEFKEIKEWLSQFKPLKCASDLCDGELISFVVLEFKDAQGNSHPATGFTCDDKESITGRLGVMLLTLKAAANQVQGWAIKPSCDIRVHCISQMGLPLQIVHSFLPDQDPEAAK